MKYEWNVRPCTKWGKNPSSTYKESAETGRDALSVGGAGEGMVMNWHVHNRDKCRMRNKTFSNLGTAIKITLQIATLRGPKWLIVVVQMKGSTAK